MHAVVNQVLIKTALNSHSREQISLQYGKGHNEDNICRLKRTL